MIVNYLRFNKILLINTFETQHTSIPQLYNSAIIFLIYNSLMTY